MELKSITNKTATKTRLIAYSRVSKEKDDTGSLTVETQEKRMRECLDHKYGDGNYQITSIQDDGIPGLTPTGVQTKVRPSLQKIADLIKTDEYDGLVVYSLSCLARNVRTVIELVEDTFIPYNKELISATEELVIHGPDSLFLINIQSIIREKYRDEVVRRNREAAASRAEQGLT